MTDDVRGLKRTPERCFYNCDSLPATTWDVDKTFLQDWDWDQRFQDWDRISQNQHKNKHANYINLEQSIQLLVSTYLKIAYNFIVCYLSRF